MKLEATMGENGVMHIEYDEETRDQLVKSAIYAALYASIDKEKIGELEQKVAKLKRKNKKLKKRLNEK